MQEGRKVRLIVATCDDKDGGICRQRDRGALNSTGISVYVHGGDVIDSNHTTQQE